nr:zinc finger, CCHC-type [Tanacetum cinerariifolium]
MAGNTMKEMTTNFRKLDKFERHDFKRWQKKMHFLLTTLKVGYVLTTLMPELLEDATAKELWDLLESKYMAEDFSSKKFLVSNFNNYKMVDSRPVMEQYNELLRILGQYTQHGLKMDESISFSSIVNKLPPSWKDFKHTLKHGKDDLSLVDAILWWIDSDATTHVCKDRCWFKTYEPVKDGSVLYMGNDYFAPVHGKGSVALEFSSGKTITLFNVLYVPKLQKNLVSGPMLNKCGYKQVYESDKYILSKSAPYTPQQNGVAERKNRALKEMVNSMLSYSGLSEGFWEEAMLTTCYLLNMIPNKRNKTTPYELWYKKRPNLEFLRVWGCRAVVRLPDQKRKTLGEKGIDCIFVGYAEHSKAYRFYIIEPNDSVSINLIIELRDAIFDENRFFSIPRPKDIIPNSNESQRDDLSDDVPNEIPEPRKDKRVWKAKSKMKVDGTFDKFKVRLVIQGFRQKEGIDYFDTYAPVARINTIRLLLALAATHNLVIHQMVVKTSFFNGDLDEEVYMKQPKGFIMPGNEHKFDDVVLSSGFHLNQSDKCVYSKFDDSGKGVIICLYVDDMLIFGTDQNQADLTKKFLSSRFSMKDMGEADVILGKPIDQLEYSRAIGCLMYAMTSTRPDIAYVVGRLSRRGAISWASKKQTCITSSTMESEFVALAVAGKEAEWLRNLIHEISIWPKPIAPISIRCDSDPKMAGI